MERSEHTPLPIERPREERIEHAKTLLTHGSPTEAPTLASQLGLPNRILRLKAIEEEVERMRQRLASLYEQERQACAHNPGSFPGRWRRRLEGISFVEANELIAEHNDWFPVEASLPWNHDIDDFRAPFGIPWRKRPLDVAWALELFPAE